VASQRSGRIDPNPHQIDAVIFALQRIPEGGCILADEVGLGKTIEAGLVIAQLLAEGRERILLMTPKALLGQWRQELFTLFSITTTEFEPGVDLAQSGVFLVTRDFAGSDKGFDALGGIPPFDLCVIDEAHEYFAGLYKRYDRYGAYLPDSEQAKTAGRVRELLLDTPVLLLTATPIQNSLAELWGLVQFVEPTGTLLGNLATFREMFTAGDDRSLAAGQENELQKRVARVCQRTLRRQAQEFMTRPFVGRQAQLVPYRMSLEERSLYDDVTAYLMEPGICAFRGNQRRLLLIGFHRRMASSIPALAASLEKVAQRLERMLAEAAVPTDDGTADALLDDLEEDELQAAIEEDIDEGSLPPPEKIEAEIERVRGFVERARSIPSDAKARALVQAADTVLQRAARGEGTGKVVVFTESITTQNYLREVLTGSGLVSDEEVTLFRGTNDGPRAMQALERWRSEELVHLPRTAHPTREVAVRLALVHEFRTRSKVFISTEAGAKGLNLQFAGTLINYDLPWNPQRIEQRIGRIHRYGQTKDVLVINFAAEDNEAQRLTLEILTQKLELFGTVLGASDEVLHKASRAGTENLAGALGADFESRLNRIYQQARSQQEIEDELVALRESMEEKRATFEDTHRRTAGLIEGLDDQVKQVFRKIQEALPGELAAFDHDLERVVRGYLDAIGARYRRADTETGARLEVEASLLLPEALREGFVAHLGDARGAEDVEPLHLGHPLVKAALEEAREATASTARVRLERPVGVRGGERGKLRLLRLRFHGYEALERIVPVAVLEGSPDPLDLESAEALLAGEATDAPELRVNVPEEDLEDATEEILFDLTADISATEQQRFAKAVAQIETALDDRTMLLERRRADTAAKLVQAEKAREAAVGSENRTKAERRLARIEDDLGRLDDELDALRRRQDDDYERWMKRANTRRSQPPRVEKLLDVEFELVGADE
jgi:predicted  nucleic acid-binding Zn-ribbon protein